MIQVFTFIGCTDILLFILVQYLPTVVFVVVVSFFFEGWWEGAVIIIWSVFCALFGHLVLLF